MTMRFEEVTERLGATVNRPGKQGDGLPLNVAIPSMGNMRIWQAVHGGYTWVIAYEPGLPEWPDEDKERFVGYTASYRKAAHTHSTQTIHIDDGATFDTFTKAEKACKRTWQQIRNAA